MTQSINRRAVNVRIGRRRALVTANSEEPGAPVRGDAEEVGQLTGRAVDFEFTEQPDEMRMVNNVLHIEHPALFVTEAPALEDTDLIVGTEAGH